MSEPDAGHGTVDHEEVARFSEHAEDWWDPDGSFKPLHGLNPARIAFIKGEICRHFQRDIDSPAALGGLRLLDIGCGGGLMSEPMARLGARVVGADASRESISIARAHAQTGGVDIDYRATTAEALADAGEQFDIVLSLEIVEHVADAELFMNACARLVRPGGLTVLSTLNRTLKAFLQAIVGAEYVLGWLPRGTHDWRRFLTPDELKEMARATGLEVTGQTGLRYHPLHDTWTQTADLSVNYMLACRKPGA